VRQLVANGTPVGIAERSAQAMVAVAQSINAMPAACAASGRE
jgi:hypothetical protein